jgi:hypothetical protein
MEIQTAFRYYLYNLVKYSFDCSSSLYNKYSPEHTLIGQYPWPFFIAPDSRHNRYKAKQMPCFHVTLVVYFCLYIDDVIRCSILMAAKIATKNENYPKALPKSAVNQSEAKLWVFGTPMFCGAVGFSSVQTKSSFQLKEGLFNFLLIELTG